MDTTNWADFATFVVILGLFLVASTLASVGGVVGLVRSMLTLRRLRPWLGALDAAQASSIAESVEGDRLIEGRVEAVEPLESPLRREACVAYDVRVRGGWLDKTLHRKVRHSRFRLVDETGAALVDAPGRRTYRLEIDPRPRREAWSRLDAETRERLGESDVEAVGVPPRGIETWRLRPGSVCTVLGRVRRCEAVGNETGYRSSAGSPVVGAGAKGLLLIETPRSELLRWARRTRRVLRVRAALSLSGALSGCTFVFVALIGGLDGAAVTAIAGIAAIGLWTVNGLLRFAHTSARVVVLSNTV